MKKLLLLLLFIPGMVMADSCNGVVTEASTYNGHQWIYIPDFPKVEVVITEGFLFIGNDAFSYELVRTTYNSKGQEELHLKGKNPSGTVNIKIVNNGKNNILIYFYYKDGTANCFNIRYLC